MLQHEVVSLRFVLVPVFELVVVFSLLAEVLSMVAWQLMSPTIGIFNTPRVMQLVASTAPGPNPHKYVLVDWAGATSAGFLRLFMTLASAEA